MRQLKICLALALVVCLAPPVFAARSEFPPSTTNNDDSCDIAVMPAATLLLPYFEVDVTGPPATARTTILTITNVTREPQIAQMAIWTDLGFPVVWFNIFLTGYDVQALNLYDIIARGVIAPTSGTSNLTPPGSLSLPNDANGKFLPTAAQNCRNLPGNIPPSIMNNMRDAVTVGRYSTCGETRIGNTHANAIGYITIDVVASCDVSSVFDASYFTNRVLYDNVLLGDYAIIDPNPTTGNYAGGNPMVHIRAVPEGGAAGTTPATSLPYTFYDRYTGRANVARTIDRRQPLPSSFAARFIQGGNAQFNTQLRVWREGVESTTACGAFAQNSTAAMGIAEVVRFDEHENPTVLATGAGGNLPLTSSTFTNNNSIFPPLSTGTDVAGWLYLNMNNGGSSTYSVAGTRDFLTNSSTQTVRQNQNWVLIGMNAEGRYAVEYDAGVLGNGCSPAPPARSVRAIGPSPNDTP